jgi:hypothetical protein
VPINARPRNDSNHLSCCTGSVSNGQNEHGSSIQAQCRGGTQNGGVDGKFVTSIVVSLFVTLVV